MRDWQQSQVSRPGSHSCCLQESGLRLGPKGSETGPLALLTPWLPEEGIIQNWKPQMYSLTGNGSTAEQDSLPFLLISLAKM